jgi:CheY-like chemotaxis protein
MKKDLSAVEVLLVEDNPDDTELTVHALTEGNKSLQLLHLKDGVEALSYIHGKKVGNGTPQTGLRLVLLDLKLPKLDGLEVLRKIREDERTKTLPVVILTSSRERRDITEAYKLGVNSYVVKPVGFDNFVKTISSIAFYWSQVNEKPI